MSEEIKEVESEVVEGGHAQKKDAGDILEALKNEYGALRVRPAGSESRELDLALAGFEKAASEAQSWAKEVAVQLAELEKKLVIQANVAKAEKDAKAFAQK